MLYEVITKNDAGYYMHFYATCIASGYQEILPQVEAYLNKIGRLLYVELV